MCMFITQTVGFKDYAQNNGVHEINVFNNDTFLNRFSRPQDRGDILEIAAMHFPAIVFCLFRAMVQMFFAKIG